MRLLALFASQPTVRTLERDKPFRTVATKVYAIVEAYTVTGTPVLPTVCYDEAQTALAEARYAMTRGISVVVTTLYQ